MNFLHLKSVKFFAGAFLFLASFQLAQAQSPPTSTVSNVKDACDGLINGSFDVTIDLPGTTGPYNIFVFGLAHGQIVTISNIPSAGVAIPITGLRDDNYLINVGDSDPSNSNYTTFQNINADASISATIDASSPKDNNSCAAPNGFIHITVTGGSGNFTYAWTATNGFTSSLQDINNIVGGDYSVSITDNNTNCSRTLGPFTVADPSPLTYNVATSTPAMCLGGSGTVTLSNSESSSVSYQVFKGGVLDSNVPAQTGVNGLLTFNIPSLDLTPAATYNFTIQATNGSCTPVMMNGTAAITVNPKPTSATLSAVGSTNICVGSSTTIKVDVVGGTPNYNFTITNGPVEANYVTGTSISVSPASTTTYDLGGVTVTDSKGCTVSGTGSVMVTVNPIPTVVTNAPAAVCSPSTVDLTAAAVTAGSTAGLTYTYWTDAGATIALGTPSAVSVSGTYYIKGTSAANCSAIQSVVVTINPKPTSATLSAVGSTNICVGSSTTIKVDVVGGTPNYNFTITNGPVEANYVTGTSIVVGPGSTTTYDLGGVIVTDSKGCTVSGTGSVMVTVNPIPTVVTNAPAAVCSPSTVDLTAAAVTAGSTAGLTYTYWTDAGATIALGTPSAVSVSGTYYIKGTSAANCSAIQSVVVTINPKPTSAALSAVGSTNICVGSSTTIKVDVVGGTPNYNFTITNGPVEANYVTGTSISVSPGSTTTYDLGGVTVTDSKGCTVSGTGSVMVTVNPIPTVVTNAPAAVCSPSTVDLTAAAVTAGSTAGLTYTYWTDAGATIALGTPSAVSVSGTYYIKGTSAANCSAIQSVVVTINPKPTSATLSAVGSTNICVGSSTTIKVDVVGGTPNYNFTITNGPVEANYVTGTSIVVSPASTTTYDLGGVTVTDSKGCTVSGTGSVMVTVNPIPTVVTNAPAAVCSPSTVDLTAAAVTAGSTAGLTYTYWTDAGATVALGTPNAVAASGTYYIKGTSAANCSAIQSVVVTVNPGLTSATLSAVGSTNICFGSSTTIKVDVVGGTPNYNFTITNGPVEANYVTGTSIVVSPGSTTTYDLGGVTVTDLKGCTVSGTGSVMVTVNPIPTVVTNAPAAVCSPSTVDLTAAAVTAGSTAGLTYTYWTDAGATVALGTPNAVAASGTYYIKGTSAANCSAIQSVVVTVNPGLTSATLSAVGSISICAGSSTTLKVDVVGGTPNYNFTITNGPVEANYVTGTSISVSPGSTTTYDLGGVTVTDLKGCTVSGTGSVMVTVNPIPTVVTNAPAAVCSPSTVDLTAAAVTAGSTAGLTFTYWTDAAATIALSTPSAVSVSGTYYIKGTSAANCSAIQSVVVTVNPGLTSATLSAVGSTNICFGSSTTIKVDVVGGTPNYNFTITNGPVEANYVTGTSIVVGPGSTTTYDLGGVTVTDSKGCTVSGTGSVMVTVNPIPTVVTNAPAAVCSPSTVDLTAAAVTAGSSAGLTFTYWTDAGATSSLSNPNAVAVSGTYYIKGTSAANCSAIQSVVVTINPKPTASISGSTTICSGSSANLSVTFTGASPWIFSYTDGTSTFSNVNSAFSPFTIPVSPTSSTIYTLLSVSDANCTGTLGTVSATVSVDSAPDVTLAVGAAVSPLCGGGSTTIDVTGSEIGISYQLRNGVTNVGSAITGTGSTINLPTGVLNSTTTFNVLATHGVCTPVQLNNTATVTVAGSINSALTVTAQASPICSGSGTNIQVAASENGVNYQLRDNSNNSNVGSVVAGTGASIDLPTGNLAASTTFNVLASNGTCSAQLTSTATVNVDVNPNSNLTLGSTLDPVCSGGSSAITVANSENGVSYQLRDNSNNSNVGVAVVGNGGTINLTTGTLAATTTFNVLATGGGACASVQLNGTVTITVSGSINAALAVAPQTTSVCGGSGGNFGFMLKLQDENFYRNMNFNSSDYSNAGLRPKLDITYSIPGPIVNSISLQPDAAAGKDAVLHGLASNANINYGNNVQFIASAWTFSSVPGVVRSVIQFDFTSIPSNATITSAKLSLYASDGSGGSPQHSTLSGPNDAWLERVTSSWSESTVTWNTQPTTTTQNRVSLPSSISPTEDYLNIDVTTLVQDMTNTGSSSTSIDISNSEVGVNYQLRDNSDNTTIGSPVAGTGGTISLPTGNLSATTTFNILAASGTCSIQMTTTPTVTVDVNPNTSLTTSASVNPVCSGGSTNITVANSENGVSYQLRDASNTNIGTPVVGNGATISLPSGALASNTTFNVLATRGACPGIQLTNTVSVTVGGAINAGLTITAQSSPICSGLSTNILVANSEVGVNYQLQDNSNNANIGSAVAGTGATINLPTGNLAATTTFDVLASNGTCSIQMTSTASVTVSPQPSAGLAVSAQNSAVCSGTGTNIKVSGSEVGVSYQLRDNSNNNLIGTAVAGTGATINLPTGNLTVNTTFNVLASGGGSCSVQLTTLASVSVLAPTDPLCSGTATNCGAFTILATDTRPTCSGQDDGTITISVTGGSPNYIATLSDPTQSFNQALAGPGPFTYINLSPSLSYQYTIQDGVGNSCTLPYSLPIQTNVKANATGFVDAVCYNQAVGQATITVTSGGTSPYVYSLDNGQTWVSFTSPVTINNLMPAAAPYSILVADDAADQCPAQVSVTINNTVGDILITSTTANASCLNNDGSVQITSLSGGTGPYTFQFDGQSQSGISYNGLAAKNYDFIVTDANSCTKTFPFTITSPGYADFTTTVADPTCLGSGGDGKVDVTINTSGNFDIGITTDPVNDPSTFQFVGVSNISTPVTFTNLSQGTYRVIVKPNGALCSTPATVVINGGPVAVDFEYAANNFVCFEAKGTIDIYKIKGSNAVDYTFEIISTGNIVRTGTVTQLQTLDTVRLPLPQAGLDRGDYQVRLFQDQSAATGCALPISSQYKDFFINGPTRTSFDTLSVVRTNSELTLATGSMTIDLQNTFAPPYLLNLHLLASDIPGQTNGHNKFETGWIPLDSTSIPIQFVASDLYAGLYRLSIIDKYGCKRIGDLTISVDAKIYIPNIFTPNNDGRNDNFEIVNLPPKSNILIANRWGKEVYNKGNIDISQNILDPNNPAITKTIVWNGGAESDGVYYYTLTTPTKTYTGWIELQR